MIKFFLFILVWKFVVLYGMFLLFVSLTAVTYSFDSSTSSF